VILPGEIEEPLRNHRIHLGDDDYMIAMMVPNNGFAIYTPRVGDKLTVAGWWN
jgi:hypothetical protein